MNAQRITQSASFISTFEQELFCLFFQEEILTAKKTTQTPVNFCSSYPAFTMDDWGDDLDSELGIEDCDYGLDIRNVYIEEDMDIEFSEPEWIQPNTDIEFTELELSFFNTFTKEEEAWFNSEPMDQWDTCDHNVRVVGNRRLVSDEAISIGWF